MAGMEALAWLIIGLACVAQIRAGDWGLLRANRGLVAALLLLFASVVASVLTMPQEKSAFFQIGFMRWIFVLWGLAFALGQAWDLGFEKSLVRLWMVMVGFLGLYGLLQCLTGVDLIREGRVLPQGDGIFKAVGFFSLSLTFAYSLGLSTFAVSLPALGQRRVEWGVLTCLLGAVGLISSMSRGAWLASILCVLIYLLVNRPRWVLPSIACFGFLATALTFFSGGFGRKIVDMAQLKVDHSSSMRLDLWRAYWQIFLDHPWFGIGLLDGDKLVPEYYLRLGIDQPFVSHAHNNLLQWLAGAGLFGFCAYVTVIGIFLVKTWRLRAVNFAWGWSLLLAQIFLHLGGLTEANFINASVNHFLVFIWAIVLTLEQRGRGQVPVV